MTATEAINGARDAGLRLFVIDKELRVRGPAAVMDVWNPIIKPLSEEIHGQLDVTVSGVLEADDRRCSSCGRAGFVILVEDEAGDRFCRSCMAEAR
jgi:hypothetical protein